MSTPRPKKWAVGSNQYVKRPGRSEQAPSAPPSAGVPPAPARSTLPPTTLKQLGITWDHFDVDRILPSAVERSRLRFRAHLPELIWNAAKLEGNTFTLPEVRTLLDGVTVGGKPTQDADQVLALSQAYNRLDEHVAAGTFQLSKAISDEFNGLAAQHEAIDAGMFRGEGTGTGGGHVQLTNGGRVEGTPHGRGGAGLRQHFDALTAYLGDVDDPRQRALVYFASATRRQFYFDGNKRTARLMMTGELMSNGYDIVSIPYARKLEFNNALDTLFTTNSATDLLRLLGDCPIN